VNIRCSGWFLFLYCVAWYDKLLYNVVKKQKKERKKGIRVVAVGLIMNQNNYCWSLYNSLDEIRCLTSYMRANVRRILFFTKKFMLWRMKLTVGWFLIWALVHLLNGKDIGNPPWRRSLPHVLVATLSSFIFGYHLAYVPNLWNSELFIFLLTDLFW